MARNKSASKPQKPKKGKVFRVSEDLADYLNDLKSPEDTWDSVIRTELDFTARPKIHWTHTGELHNSRKSAKAAALKFGAKHSLEFEDIPAPIKVRVL